MARGTLQVAVAAAFVTLALSPGAASAAPPPTLPAPTYQSVSNEVLVTMDDGVKLAGDGRAARRATGRRRRRAGSRSCWA